MRRTGIGKAGILLGVLLLAGSSGGCGPGEEPEEDSQSREVVLTGVLVPKAEFGAVNYDLQNLGEVVWRGDSLIWQVPGYDAERRQGRSTWMEGDMAGLEEARAVAAEDEVRSVTDLFTDLDDNLYLFGWEYAQERYYLLKRDASGRELYTVYPQTEDETPDRYEGFADSEGNVVLVNPCSERAVILDGEGNRKGSVELELPAWDVYLVDGGPEGVYLAAADIMKEEVRLQEVSFGDGTLGPVRTVKLPRQGDANQYTNGHAVLLGGGRLGLLLSEKDTLSYFDLQEGRGEKLLDWNLLEINGTVVSGIRPEEADGVSDGKPRFEVLLAGGEYERLGFEPETARISWIDEGYRTPKQTLVVGEGLGLGALDQAVRRFNRKDGNYRVEVKSFGYQELQKVAMGGDSVPDIIDVHAINVAVLYDKNLLENLEPWLEKSKVISREEIGDAAYEAGTLDGKLYSIVPKYSIAGLVTSGNAIGREGFTMEDYAAKAAQYPDARVAAPCNMYYLIRQTLSGMLDDFVDWEKGRCSFDSKEFSEYLSLLGSMSPDLLNAGGDNSGRFHSGVERGTVLYDLYYCTGPEDFYSSITQKKDKLEMIGYPSLEGEPFYTVCPQQQYAIYADSPYKEGAWEFLEFLLQEEQQLTVKGMFPASRSVLERYLSESAAGEEDRGREEAEEAVRYLLEHAHLSQIDGRNSPIYTIISEELEAFLRGEKSLEDTADVIQSRASLYMGERD